MFFGFKGLRRSGLTDRFSYAIILVKMEIQKRTWNEHILRHHPNLLS